MYAMLIYLVMQNYNKLRVLRDNCSELLASVIYNKIAWRSKLILRKYPCYDGRNITKRKSRCGFRDHTDEIVLNNLTRPELTNILQLTTLQKIKIKNIKQLLGFVSKCLIRFLPLKNSILYTILKDY